MTQTERTTNMVPTLVVKSNAGNSADVLLWADPTTHRLLIDGSFSGSLTNNNAAPGSTNLGALVALANAAAPSWTEGNQVLLSTDLAGALRVTGSLSVGGTTDNSAFTAGTSTGTPSMGFYHSTIDTVTDGRAAVVALTSKRAQHVTLHTAAGVETGVAAAPLQVSVANTGANATAIKVDGSAVTQPVSLATVAVTNAGTFVVQENGSALTALQLIDDTVVAQGTALGTTKVSLLGGSVTTAAPTYTTGQISPLNLTTGGALRVDVATFAGTAPVTGSGTATGALRVELANNGTGVLATVGTVTTVSTVTTLSQFGGNAINLGNGAVGTGTLRVTMANDSTGILAGVTTVTTLTGSSVAHDGVDSGNPHKMGAQARTTNPTAVADADRTNLIADKLGKLVVVGSIRDLKGNQITTITSSTAETTVATAIASTFIDVYGVIVVNSSATAANVSFKDSTAGTTRFNIYVPAGETRGFMLNESAAIAQTTVNNNWTATSSASVASLIITMLYVKNI